LRHSLDFIGSLYARTNRWKHLQLDDPDTYAGGDALGTYDAWQVLGRELDRDRRSRQVYEYELKVQLPILLARSAVNLDSMHIASAAAELAKEQEEVKQRGMAVAGWPLSISSPDQVARWLRLKRDAQAE
jgi:DNA polymerase I-like protein with 3'-5' exonuclease and polymerase domains